MPWMNWANLHLFESILNYIASFIQAGDQPRVTEELSHKLILMDPTNKKWIPGFNPLETKGIDAHTQALEFMQIFRKLWTDSYFGPRMEELLRNTLITLSLNELTLLEAKALLTDSKFRESLLTRLPQGEVKEYWLSRYGSLSEKMQALYREPILNRLSVFLTDSSIRAMVGQKKSTIDFRTIMDQSKWLLVNLSKGRLKSNSQLLGALIIAKLQLAALSRVDLPEARRIPFFVYVDEFQNFVVEDFKTILSEARKYRLGLILAHQNLDQLDKELRAAILGNVATQIIFRLSNHDAAIMSPELSQKEKTIVQRRLIDLKVGRTYLKTKGERPRLMQTVHVPNPQVESRAVEAVKNFSFSRYSRLLEQVEKELAERAETVSGNNQVFQNQTAGTDPDQGRFAPQQKFEEGHEW